MPLPCLTEDELFRLVRERVAAAGSQLEAARALGISPQYLNDVLHRRRQPGPKLAGRLGYRRVTTYQPL